MRLIRCVLAVSVLTLVAACGGGDEGGEGITGDIRVDGSSTVFPITEAVAEEFMRDHPRARVTVGVSGTGGGFAKFLRGETDINDASRPIKPSEVQLAEQNGVQYIELPVAYDGLAVVGNPQNDWLECLTLDELRQIWEPNSDVNSWSQIRASFPDDPLRLYGPGTDSGTYDYFTEAVMGESGASRSDFTASEDDNVLVQGIQGDANALGFFGLAYYEENAERLKLIGVDDGDPENGDGCIEPSPETVADGTYQPLSRPLFIYVRADAADDPAVSAFTEYYIHSAGELAPETGYVSLSEEAYDLALQRFDNVVTGTLFEGEGAQVGVRLEDVLHQQDGAVDTTMAR